MKLKKIITWILTASMALSFTACGGNNSSSSAEDPNMLATAPDYSKYTHQFDFYGYGAPTDGYWTEDDLVFYAGEDFRTVERYKEYKDAGFTILMPQSTARIGVTSGNYREDINGVLLNLPEAWPDNFSELRTEEWENTKVYWDKAREAGIEKIIMTDVQIQQFSNVKYGLLIKPENVVIPEGEKSPYMFQSQEAFDDAIEMLLGTYIDYPAFYGVMLADEPSYACVESYGQTYRALKRVAKERYNRDIFVQHNLLPMRAYGGGAYTLFPLLEWFDEEEDSISMQEYYDLVGGVTADQVVNPQEKLKQILEAEIAANGGSSSKTAALKYEKYVEGFALSMGSDYIQFDDYPLRGTEDDPSVISVYLCEMQVVANVAKKLGINFYMVTQSYGVTENDKPVHRVVSNEDCYWLNNTLLAFGVSQIVYYTYFAKSSNSASHFTLNEGSFVTRNGEKTDIYYSYQKIMAENQKFAPTYLNFKYQGSRVYSVLPLNFGGDYLTEQWVDNSYNFVELKNFTVNKETALVTESYDKENNRYMYCVQNIVDAAYKGSLTFQTTKLTFDSAKYKYVAIYRNGERTLQALDNGTVTIKNAAGQAAYVIPY